MTHSDTATAQDLIENRIGVLLSLLVTIIICAWIGSAEADTKYVLYALPGLMMLTCAMLARWRVAVDRSGLGALLIYSGIAAVSTMAGSYGPFALRDLLIILGYLLLFVLAFRSPGFVADACLASLAAATVVVAMNAGIVENLNILGSAGILESPLAFPLGIVFLYYAGTRQWGRAIIAFALFFLAFKRIAIAGALAVLAIEYALMLVGRRHIGRLLAAIVVIASSVLALFLLDIFDYVALLLNNEQISANNISLGRFEFASVLWRDFHEGGWTHQLLGFGPGAASAYLDRAIADTNPHNDWLKILFDYGVVGFVAFHVVLYLIHPRTPHGDRLYIYLAIIMCTDNVLIYVFYFVYLFLILRIVDPGGRTLPRSRRAPAHRRHTEVWS